jgi:putative membrane-bound dehydrogenase-like protein
MHSVWQRVRLVFLDSTSTSRIVFGFIALVAGICGIFAAPAPANAQKEAIPHAQDKPPGPALSPAEAIRKMTVPEGFSVEVVASEPDIVNPVAMTIDEKGRFWITESLEYPRKSAGPGKDRVKVLEDTDEDGKADKFTVFAEGLNIPSGVAVGHGGVWVANAPDILFLQDTDGDGKADKQEVIVTGFGRDDTHELPNSLTWGPDGWLYGLNGVFNYSHVRYPPTSPHFKPDHPGFPITCALYRIHPKTREFQVFCEGTSNPWGVAFDNEGSAFISACVIDHLWHLTQSGYYHRQGGPYPPYTWKIESIVKHKHQKAAYCGIHYFDSEAYPEKYRQKLYMGNIHGGCLNVDVLQRDGSSYFATGEPDFLTANDAWFMPVVQKTGPDGCLYVLDWYDRYHCYQDANRDPAGIDRLKGRLYRIRYKETPRAPKFDLAAETNDQLIERLGGPNDYFRDTSRRVLNERLLAGKQEDIASLTQKLYDLAVGTTKSSPKAQRGALFLVCGSDAIDSAHHLSLLNHADPFVRAWGVRATTSLKQLDNIVRDKALALTTDPSRDVQLQVAIAAKKLAPANPSSVLLAVLANWANDKLIPHIVWQNLQPTLEQNAASFVEQVAQRKPAERTNFALIIPRAVERMLGRKEFDATPIVKMIDLLTGADGSDFEAGQLCLGMLSSRVQTGEISGAKLESLKSQLQPILNPILSGDDKHSLILDAALLATSWKDPAGLATARKILGTHSQPAARRIQALEALVSAKDAGLIDTAAAILHDKNSGTIVFRGQVLAALGRLQDATVAATVLKLYIQLDPELQPRAIELLTQRVEWSKSLLGAIGAKSIPSTALNVNQVRKILATKDPELIKQVEATWGILRDQRNPQREQVIADMRLFLRKTEGNAEAGKVVFARVCGQCHKLHGEGVDVGPDITLNGRSSFEQLLSNVFDPSLVIGASYQAQTIVTTEGRVLTGLVAEDSEQRVVLKVQGGKQETIPRNQIEESKKSNLSMMPEDLEKQLKPQELADLFAYITLDKPPSDPTAKRLPGSQGVTARETTDPAQFNELVAVVAPGFGCVASGENGIGILAEHLGRPGVLRTHPIDLNRPCILVGNFKLPAGKKSYLIVDVSRHPKGDWRLVAGGNGERLLDEMINEQSTKDGWASFKVDLSKFAGKDCKVQLLNQANDWSYEFGYFGRVEIVNE